MGRSDFNDTMEYTFCGRFHGGVTTNTTERVTCLPNAIRGRFVFIAMLTPVAVLCLCEVEIYAGRLKRNMQLSQLIVGHLFTNKTSISITVVNIVKIPDQIRLCFI